MRLATGMPPVPRPLPAGSCRLPADAPRLRPAAAAESFAGAPRPLALPAAAAAAAEGRGAIAGLLPGCCAGRPAPLAEEEAGPLL